MVRLLMMSVSTFHDYGDDTSQDTYNAMVMIPLIALLMILIIIMMMVGAGTSPIAKH